MRMFLYGCTRSIIAAVPGQSLVRLENLGVLKLIPPENIADNRLEALQRAKALD